MNAIFRSLVPMMKMEQVTDNGAGGGATPPQTTGGYETPPVVQPEAAPQAGGSSDDKGTPPSGSSDETHDEYGYELTDEQKAERAKAKTPEAGDKSKQDPAADPDITKVKGYGEKIEVPEKPVVPPPVEEKIDLGYELNEKDVDAADAKKLREFAKAHGLTKEQAQAYLDIRRDEDVQYKQQFEQAKVDRERKVQEQRASWQKELKDDPVFGGTKYAHNVHMAMKVIEDHFPDLKKDIDEQGVMLKPYLMRAFAKLGETKLYATPKFVPGTPQAPPPDKSNDDGLGFYR